MAGIIKLWPILQFSREISLSSRAFHVVGWREMGEDIGVCECEKRESAELTCLNQSSVSAPCS
jgi:hypothetical protein